MQPNSQIMLKLNKKPIAYVDMDDTLCDFEGACKESILKMPIIRIPWSVVDFFRKLKPLPGAIEGINELAKYYDVWILSKPSIHNPMSYMEKRLWVEDHLGFDWCKKLILCPDKSLMKGHLLIDDVMWSGFEGTQLYFGSPSTPSWKIAIEQSISLLQTS